MTITRGVAAGAMFAGLALGLPAPMSAADPLNGHYIETETYPDGHQCTTTGTSLPAVTAASIRDLGQANLVDGQWTLDGNGGVTCEQGGDIPNAIDYHYSWDPNSLAGTVKITNNEQACGNPKGYQETNQLQLAPAPRRRSSRGRRWRARRTPACRRRFRAAATAVDVSAEHLDLAGPQKPCRQECAVVGSSSSMTSSADRLAGTSSTRSGSSEFEFERDAVDDRRRAESLVVQRCVRVLVAGSAHRFQHRRGPAHIHRGCWSGADEQIIGRGESPTLVVGPDGDPVRSQRNDLVQQRHVVAAAAGIDCAPSHSALMRGPHHRQDRRHPDSADDKQHVALVAAEIERVARPFEHQRVADAKASCISIEPPPPSAIRRTAMR